MFKNQINKKTRKCIVEFLLLHDDEFLFMIKPV